MTSAALSRTLAFYGALMFYLFLDFDGVLHPCTGNMRSPFSCLPRFAEFLRKNPTVHVVISSSWRKTSDFKTVLPPSRLRKYFPEDVRHRIVGCTPALRGVLSDEPDYLRQREIDAWRVQKKKTAVPFAILDDDASYFAPHLPSLFLCDPAVGFDAAVEAQLQHYVDRCLAGAPAAPGTR